jgi:tRNA nucleotidyltransferase/poly(A) polymerase
MIRACRFAALIHGHLSLSSLDAVLSCSHLLDDSVAKERIQHEILKALAVKKPSLFFRALKKTGLLCKIFPSLDRCYDLDGGPHHGETVFDHCMIVGDVLPAHSPMLRLAGFLHDTGKFDAARIKEGHLTFPGHEKHTQSMVRDLTALGFPVRDIAYITALTLSHMRPLAAQTTPRAARRLLAMLDAHGLGYRDFMKMRIADRRGNLAKRPYTLSEIRVKLQKLFHEMAGQAAVNINHLAITGEDIIRVCHIPPGPEVGRIKQVLFERVLDDPGLNQLKELEKLCVSSQINE